MHRGPVAFGENAAGAKLAGGKRHRQAAAGGTGNGAGAGRLILE